ncbi:hypothetical protein E4T83_07140 [Streptococcus sp. AN2]|nr:hypothetical protein E4T83_07140 [Streptococcus sp. AN2]
MNSCLFSIIPIFYFSSIYVTKAKHTVLVWSEHSLFNKKTFKYIFLTTDETTKYSLIILT